jgi:SPP1 gp7 family putative phage head morphogenesis protein
VLSDLNVTETANKMQIFTSQIEQILKDSSGYKSAEKALEQIEFNVDEIAETMGAPLTISMSDGFNTGKVSVNPQAELIEFQDIGFDFDLESSQMIDFMKINGMSIAHITHQQVLDSVKEQMIRSAQLGIGYQGFLNELGDVFNNTGVTPPNPFHLQTVYIQNNTNAYQAGRFLELNNPDILEIFPFSIYKTLDDGNVRPSHQAMHNFIARATDPIWNKWSPPNGFRCRCDREGLTAEEAEAHGFTNKRPVPINPDTGRAAQPDKGFNRTPIRMGNTLNKTLKTNNVAWNTMPLKYSLTSFADKSGDIVGRTAGFEVERQLMLSSPDEIWGYLANNIPTFIYISKFIDRKTGKTYFLKAKVRQEEILSITEIFNAEKARIGAPIVLN